MRAIFIFILLLPMVAFSQTNNLGNWFIYFGNKKIDNRWNWHHEVQYRNFNFIGDTEQVLIRTGLGYNLTENNNNILLGAAFIYSEPYLANSDTKTSFNEHRIYQQFITRQTFGAVSLQHRYRFEQRFFEKDFRLRLRYFIGLNVALNKKQMMDKAVYLSAYNEIFINTENNIFDRNRLYGGLGYRFSKNVRTEVGVMNQSTSTVSRNQLNLITFFNF
ncbi:DUF2490 domain-containing protein [Riemerella anatipestifer]|uniref:DUF2490 domain-containing protein n=1 Tax=Riemerella anatipestifer (strain ATCC 11845 / DSM 15868 / JCM 9532 / NCTC 11014) TaxID=693978 RepID=E4TBJ9_RIEAD|nr:DUF2490 domain-containing protein [Riemerella anatipestifer]ADQ81828.1 Protein of unknown function DUF2490 [Riemerella anatipestifer ATCC 11845 = DSM 15868]ADZ12671.1 Protein of unknown function DUF2490 [Riemerella anatipestifer RA-GD]AFD55838.1 hypothetical protein RA0C_0900 [Riemerella anatipestifer ATCC 11845 = DSM 15868]AGC40258.1 hypothetical protein G148_0954 [Riemerella anatipestifer RA-CH-2]AKP70942.1 hypothetical protein CG09_0710 [Riemerella anatipestifer]